jgi:polysaccharide export outer membrane protein
MNRLQTKLGAGLLVVTFAVTPTVAMETQVGQEDAVLPTQLGEGEIFPTYKVLAGDLLEVVFFFDYEAAEEDYTVQIRDELQIESPFHGELNGTYVIRSDGKISLPYKGSVKVAGMTVDGVISHLSEIYADIYRDPVIFVRMGKSGAKIDELRSIITSLARGQVFRASVRPDGFLTLPAVGDLRVEGRSVDEVRELTQAAYQETYAGVGVSVIVADSPTRVFYVFGEVRDPGQFRLQRPTTVVEAIAMAGADMNQAGLRNVVVLSIHGHERPKPTVVDVRAAFKGGSPEAFLTLSSSDVVLVPKSKIAKVNQWVDQYIKKLFLFNGFNYQLNRLVGPE